MYKYKEIKLKNVNLPKIVRKILLLDSDVIMSGSTALNMFILMKGLENTIGDIEVDDIDIYTNNTKTFKKIYDILNKKGFKIKKDKQWRRIIGKKRGLILDIHYKNFDCAEAVLDDQPFSINRIGVTNDSIIYKKNFEQELLTREYSIKFIPEDIKNRVSKYYRYGFRPNLKSLKKLIDYVGH